MYSIMYHFLMELLPLLGLTPFPVVDTSPLISWAVRTPGGKGGAEPSCHHGDLGPVLSGGCPALLLPCDFKFHLGFSIVNRSGRT